MIKSYKSRVIIRYYDKAHVVDSFSIPKIVGIQLSLSNYSKNGYFDYLGTSAKKVTVSFN